MRTLDDSELDRLLTAGAAEVVPEVLEGSLMLATHSLLLLGVPLNRVLTRIRAIREERYSLFRGFFHGASDAADAADNLQPRLHSVLLPDRARAVGKVARRARARTDWSRSPACGARARARSARVRTGCSRPATSSSCSGGPENLALPSSGCSRMTHRATAGAVPRSL